MIVHSPNRKTNYYLCKIHNSDKKQITLKIPYAIVTHIIPLSNQQGYQVQLNISQDHSAVTTINEIENICIESIIKNNKKWFLNGLDELHIQNLFETTLDQERLNCYISLLRSHINIQGYTDIPEWIHANKDKLPKMVHIKLLCDGLFIYPKRFGLRWIIESIQEIPEENEEIIPDYDDILHYWQDKVDTTKKIYLSKIDAMDRYMKLIEQKEFSEKDIQELKTLL